MDMQRSEVANPVYDMEFEECHTDPAQAEAAADVILEALEQSVRPVIMLGTWGGQHRKSAGTASFYPGKTDTCYHKCAGEVGIVL